MAVFMPQAAVLCYALAAAAAVQAWEPSASSSQCDALSESLAQHSYLQNVYKPALERMGCVNNASQAADGLQQGVLSPRLPHHRALLDTSSTGDTPFSALVLCLQHVSQKTLFTPQRPPSSWLCHHKLAQAQHKGHGPAYLKID